MNELSPSNAPEWTVGELSKALRRTLEDAYGHVRLRGEVSNYRGPHSSGHVYFCLKDQDARIDAIIWKMAFARLKFRPEEGMEVIATGRVTTFPGKSSYQIVIEQLEPAGVGALLAQLEERRKRLAAEGLFSEERKRPLPFLPLVIGIVTSPTGAVIRDILHRLADRFPRHVLVWPVRVQGETSAAEVSAAIVGFNALPAGGPIPRPDLLIVARGGGSLEDLWSFNDEAVVRAAAGSAIPLIAAVGHETDWTLIDHAADHRAPTPTAAAEKSVPVRGELLLAVDDLGRRKLGALLRRLERAKAELRAAARALPSPDALLAGPSQRLDRAGGKLTYALTRNLAVHRADWTRLGQRLARVSPHVRLATARARLDGLDQRLARGLLAGAERRRARLDGAALRFAGAGAARFRQAREHHARCLSRLRELGDRSSRALAGLLLAKRRALASLDQLLESYSYHGVLARGFALVRDAQDRPVRSVLAVQPGMALDIELADGRFRAAAGEVPRRSPRPRAAPGPAGQPSLFDD